MPRSSPRLSLAPVALAVALAAAPSLAAEPSAPEGPMVFSRELALGGRAFQGPTALCEAFVADARARLLEPTSLDEELEVPPRSPRCRADAEVPVSQRGPFRSVRALDLDDGRVSRRQLAVTTPRGTYLTWLAWQVDDPADPGCPSNIHPLAVEAIRVDHGHLVVTMVGERTTYETPVPEGDPSPRAELVRMATWIADRGERLEIFDWSETLGSKVQPAADRHVPWERLRWQAPRVLRLDEAGRPRVEPP